MTKLPELVLASASPRRREILENAGLRFIVRPADVVEKALAGESPVDYVLRLAREKAGAVSAAGGEVILAADTVVVVDGLILEKPAAADAAIAGPATATRGAGIKIDDGRAVRR